MKISFLKKISNSIKKFFKTVPENKEQLIQLLRESFDRNLMDSDALSMIEGVLQVSELQARDIIIPRPNMYVIDINEPIEKIIQKAIKTAHSRFPVTRENKDDIIGILHAKDLLQYYQSNESFNLKEMLRPAVFIPESKRLNVLLKEFRSNRNHIAIVLDEYGGVSGIITIEDVLEQIVGDIEDEFDFDETESNIVKEANNVFRVKAQTEIEDFNSYLGTNFSDREFDTIGGLILAKLGRLPKRNEELSISPIKIKILSADSRRLHYVQVTTVSKNESLS